MEIITHNKTFNTSTDPVILFFSSDEELSDFIRLLISTPPKSSGVRIIPLIDESKLDDLQKQVLNIIKLLDGVGMDGKGGDVDAAINIINALVKK